MRISRRSLIFSALGVCAAAPGYARLVEPGWLDVTTKRVPLPGLPRQVRILHLTDFHAGSDTPFSLVGEAIAAGLARNPDLVCLTGDYISWGERPDVGRLQEILRPVAASLPCYATFGNHDGGLWAARHGGLTGVGLLREALEEAGVRCLHNAATALDVAGGRLNLVGVGDLWSAEVEPEQAFAAVIEPEAPTLVLSHNPDTVHTLAAYRWGLMLSGHTHGGQVVVPLIDVAPYVPIQDRRFTKGLCSFGDRFVHVSRGVGSIMGVRFACRPEVSILDVVPV